ncbi:hypothetical protein RYX36_034896 [Vicia faba]
MASDKLQENNNIEEEQKPKKTASEIHEIFAGKKRKKTKKNSTMASDKLQENNNIEEEQKPKKAASEIDEIFAGKKRKKSNLNKHGKAGEATKSARTNEKKKPKRADEGEYLDRPSRSRKKTEDGLTIYTEEELGLSKGDAGNTPLCPFDCSCCF